MVAASVGQVADPLSSGLPAEMTVQQVKMFLTMQNA